MNRRDDMPAPYYQGVERYRAGDYLCPYLYASQLRNYCLWMAGWHDARRGLA